MNAEETKTLHRAMCRRWPGKFSADDLGFWSAKLSCHSLADVENALTRFKNTKRFVPKVDEVLALLPRYAVPASAPEKRAGESDDGFVGMVRRTHAWFKPTDGDAEVVLRYWRALWFGYERDATQRIEQVASTRGAVANEIGTQALRDAQARYDVTKRSIHRRCVMTLIGLSVDGRTIDEPQAERMSEYLFAPPDMFRVCLADVRGDPFG